MTLKVTPRTNGIQPQRFSIHSIFQRKKERHTKTTANKGVSYLLGILRAEVGVDSIVTQLVADLQGNNTGTSHASQAAGRSARDNC